MNRVSDPQLIALKTPPHSSEAEQSLLGGLLLDNSAFDRVADLVVAEDFYRDEHRRIFRHLARMAEAGKPADLTTIVEALESSDDRGKYGGAGYLGLMAQNTPSALHVRRYAEIVRAKAIQRQLAQVGTEIAEEALGYVPDVAALLDHAESKILTIGEATTRRGDGPIELQALLKRTFERIDERYQRENKDSVTGVPSGFIDLDEKTQGMHAGDLIIIAGRPSMGKTALALNIAEHVGMDNGLPVCIFSMEMNGGLLSERLLASVARVDSQKLRTGRLSDEEWGRLSAAVEKLHHAPIEIDESRALTATEIRARARRMRRKNGKLGLVIVDYLQLMEATHRSDNRATDVAEMSRAMKAMAGELDCPVIALSQLSRKVEERGDKRPQMSDLRESGAIEQDADTILFLYREEVYFPEDLDAKGWAEVIIGKQRNGPIGKVDLTFLPQFTRFENRGRDDGFGGGPPRRTRRAAPRRGMYEQAEAEAKARAA